jgi:hypothetical protein
MKEARQEDQGISPIDNKWKGGKIA